VARDEPSIPVRSEVSRLAYSDGCTIPSKFGADGCNTRLVFGKPFAVLPLGVSQLRGAGGRELGFVSLPVSLALGVLHVPWDADAGEISTGFVAS
jgi:hypothetical protein